MDTLRWERIRAGLAQARQRGLEAFGAESHGFRLNPPISAAVLQAFEGRHGVRLPEAYRDFLLHVGDGGAGQDYGLYPLKKAGGEGHLRLPSPLRPGMPDDVDWAEALGLSEDSEDAYNGILTILTQGCTYDVLLMVSGPHRGRIVYVDWNQCSAPFFSHFPDFLAWYETWLRELLAGYDMQGFGYGLSLEEPGLVRVACDRAETEDLRRAALGTLMRAPSLDPSHLEALKAALEAELQPRLATLLLVTLTGKGVRGLEDLAWHGLARAEGRQLTQVVESMRVMGMPDWPEAARQVLERDEDGDTSQSLLFTLNRHGALTPEAVRAGLASRHPAAITAALYVNHESPHPLPVPEHFLTHASPAVRRYAVEYQTEEDLVARLPLFLHLLSGETDPFVRQGWAHQFTRLSGPTARAALLGRLREETSPTVLSALVLACERARILEAVPALMDLTRHEDDLVRLEAARALGIIGDRHAAPALKALLNQHVRPFRWDGSGGVGHALTIAEVAREALHQLTR